MKRKREVFFDALKKCRAAFFALLASFLVSIAVFWLYDLPIEPFLYAFVIAAVLGIAAFCVFCACEFSKSRRRERLLGAILSGNELPPAGTLTEKDCYEALTRLKNELILQRNECENARREEIDYYTAWVHQIKTPIAVLRMELGNTEKASEYEAELFRIEQYVDMVLSYIRLGSESTDLVVKAYPLDELIRESIRKFAQLFVLKKLRLFYDGTDKTIVTDKKWFAVILEQLLSNAIKYTPSGSVSIILEGDILKIADTGIGIAPEDLPRIFEKGFTGENGRLDKRSSGLGLYLCKKSADLLRIPVAVESRVCVGTAFSLDLSNASERKTV